jgi:tetratricopeptide (TPR) repeat protein
LNEDTEATRRRQHLRSWSSSLSLAEAWASIGDCCQITDHYVPAKSAYLSGARFADASLTRPWFLNEVANAMYIAGRFDECEKFAQQAIKAEGAERDRALLAGSLNLLGLAKLERAEPDPEDALRHFHAARHNAERVLRGKPPTRLPPDALERFVSRLYNNIGLAYANTNNVRQARKYYLRSLRIKRKRGDLVGVAKTSSNICLLHYAARRFSVAQYWKRQAIEIINRYSLAFDRAYVFRRLGEISCEQGRTGQGLRHLRAALSLYSYNPDLKFGVALTKRLIKKYE